MPPNVPSIARNEKLTVITLQKRWHLKPLDDDLVTTAG